MSTSRVKAHLAIDTLLMIKECLRLALEPKRRQGSFYGRRQNSL